MNKKYILKGIVRQLTIFGQLAFIDGEEYYVDCGGDGVCTVKGKYKDINTGVETELTLDFSESELDYHIEL